jgi:2-amino-4-hydroxy-6-hydroxymethyldihydropteridine diphosphokinase
MTWALISIGSNMVDPMLQVLSAYGSIKNEFENVSMSQLYTTEPVGPVAQPPFINAAILLSTDLTADSLLYKLQSIELEAGRNRNAEQPKGPRILDLDLILFGSEIQKNSLLQLPHPSFRNRNFVLIPSREVAGEMIDPVTGLSIHELQKQCTDRSWVKVFNTERVTA